MTLRPCFAFRPLETALLVLVILLAALGFALVTAAPYVRQGQTPIPFLLAALPAPAALAICLLLLHLLLQWRGVKSEQLLLPIVGLLAALGLVMIGRLRPPEAVWQQVTRGLLPGVLLMALFIARPALVDWLRRAAAGISITGLILLVATAFFGVLDESGARLSLKLGPLPAVQTSELIKLALIIFLAWYIEKEGEAAEGRARPFLNWLRLPAVRYFIPGLLFVALATLALIKMSDFGAILILGCLFAVMLYAGFQTRIFAAVAAIGLGLTGVAGLALAWVWTVPVVIQQRFATFLNPWSAAPLAGGLTIAEGPGYQIQQALYAIIAGGLTGAGLGFGLPGNIPLAHSDFIFAALVEELGAVGGLAVLGFFAVLLARVLRVAILLPPGQLFERLLLVGIGVHLFVQVLIMVGGNLNLLPLTGVTLPFLSQGGMALLVNLLEIGLALALAQRLEGAAP